MVELRIGSLFVCTVCGQQKEVEDTKRVYTPLDCRHPYMRAQRGYVCSACYNWSYDVFGRKRDSKRKPLKTKDGKLLTEDGGIINPNAGQAKLFG